MPTKKGEGITRNFDISKFHQLFGNLAELLCDLKLREKLVIPKILLMQSQMFEIVSKLSMKTWSNFIQILTKYLEDNNCKISVYLEKRHEYFLHFFFSLNK